MITDAERAADLARDLLGDVATEEIRAALRDAFRRVRVDERAKVLDQLRESIRLRQERSTTWAEQAEYGSWS